MLLPGLLYVLSVAWGAENVPIGDDYNVILPYLDAGPDAPGLLDAHNEHRLVVTRACAKACQLLLGAVDFRLLLVLSSLSMVAGAWVLHHLLELERPWLGGVFMLLALQPQHTKLLHYPMAALQADFGLLFSSLYLLALSRARPSAAEGEAPVPWAPTLLLAPLHWLALISSGAGLFLPAVGVGAFLAWRRPRLAAAHALLALGAGALYLHGVPSSGSLGHALAHPGKVLEFGLFLCGGGLQPPYFRPTSAGLALGGLAVLGALAWLAREGVARQRPGAVLLAAYLLLNLSLIAAGRVGTYEDLAVAASDGRYLLYSQLLCAALAALLLERLARARPSPRWRAAGLVGAGLVALCFYGLEWRRRPITSAERRAGVELWVRRGDPSRLHTLAVPRDAAARELQRALAAGTYAPSFLRER